jgi:glycosyltransferase involved in cell wall biosynthesis
MKILWLSHLIPYPPKGGVLQRSYNLIKEVSKYHEIHLIAFNQVNLLGSMFHSVEEGKILSTEHLLGLCKTVKFVEIPSEKTKHGKYLLALKSLFTATPYTVNWLQSKVMLEAINKLTMQYNFDLIHFDTISLAQYVEAINRQKPLVLDHHNIESHMMLRRSRHESNILKKLYYMQEGYKLLFYEKEVCSLFDLHITCSVLDTKRLGLIDPSLKIDEVPNGVDVHYFKEVGEEYAAHGLVFAGGLNWYPNKDAMLLFAREIWPRLKARIPNVSMDVIGKDPPDELVLLSKNDNSFHVHGFVDDVRPYISRAGIYVCPIRDGGGTKLKLLDAFSMSKAVVAHPAACEGLDVIDGSHVLFAENSDEFVKKIIQLIKNEELRLSLGAAARQLVVNNYSFHEIGKKLAGLYVSLHR